MLDKEKLKLLIDYSEDFVSLDLILTSKNLIEMFDLDTLVHLQINLADAIKNKTTSLMNSSEIMLERAVWIKMNLNNIDNKDTKYLCEKHCEDIINVYKNFNKTFEKKENE